ncbi:MAG: DUF3303 family protein [Acidimicrobiia bacterium]|nr:DUF3303 family protein [Acidimicrobiia bacterium]
MAHYVLTYHFKPFMTRDEVAAMMEVYGSTGQAPGASANLVWADGTGGTVIGETDDTEALYRNLLSYGEWIEFDLKPVLPVEKATSHVADYLT